MKVTDTVSRFVFGRDVSTGVHTIPWVSPVVIGRVLLSAIFVFAGVAKFLDWEGNLAYMETSSGIVGMSWLLAVAAIVEIVGGLSILTGTLARLGAVMLILFLIPATALFHDFWSFTGPERQMQMVMFLKNLSIMGGLLLVVGFGAGKASIDEKIHAQPTGGHSR